MRLASYVQRDDRRGTGAKAASGDDGARRKAQEDVPYSNNDWSFTMEIWVPVEPKVGASVCISDLEEPNRDPRREGGW